MRFRFLRKNLRDLYQFGKGAKKYGEAVVQAFYALVSVIESAPDERTFRELESLHYEHLMGQRGSRGEHSMRLHGRFRLIVRIESENNERVVVIVAISKHYE